MFEELQAKWAPNVVVGLGRLAAGTIGVIADKPLRKGGCLDSPSAEKAARFVRMCDSFACRCWWSSAPRLPPRRRPGAGRRGAPLHAFAEAVVPRVTLVTYGRRLHRDATRWPNGLAGGAVAVMGAKAAVGILHRKKLAAAPAAEARHTKPTEEHERIAGGADCARSAWWTRSSSPATPAASWPRPSAAAPAGAAHTATSRLTQAEPPAIGGRPVSDHQLTDDHRQDHLVRVARRDAPAPQVLGDVKPYLQAPDHRARRAEHLTAAHRVTVAGPHPVGHRVGAQLVELDGLEPGRSVHVAEDLRRRCVPAGHSH